MCFRNENTHVSCLITNLYKVITAMVIRSLDDSTYVLNQLSPIYDPSVWGYVGIGMSAFGSPPVYSYNLPIDTYGLSVTVFELFSWIRKRFRPSARPSVRPGYDDKYRPRSYRFVERQKWTCSAVAMQCAFQFDSVAFELHCVLTNLYFWRMV